MKHVKLCAVVLMLAICTLAFAKSRYTYNFFVTGTDPYNGNYIVTTSIISCLGPNNVACQISSTVDAQMINGNWEVARSTSTTLFYAFSY